MHTPTILEHTYMMNAIFILPSFSELRCAYSAQIDRIGCIRSLTRSTQALPPGAALHVPGAFSLRATRRLLPSAKGAPHLQFAAVFSRKFMANAVSDGAATPADVHLS